MAKLKDFPILDFTGGLVTNKSDQRLASGELKDSLNLDLEEPGRMKRRRGIQQFGDTKTGILDESVLFLRQTAGSTPTSYHLTISRVADGLLYTISGNYNTLAIAVGDGTITLGNNIFTGSGTVEINGDLIAYSGVSGATLTGVTGILKAHPAFSRVNEINLSTVTGATGVDTRSGAYFSILNNLLVIDGKGMATFDGTTLAEIADTDRPAGIFITNYRDRLYVAGDSSTDAAKFRNGSPVRVSYSEPGDPTDWGTYTVNFFDVEDDRGESITGLAEMNDALLIFKQNSTFSYDEVQLKQRLWNVGAYNHKVIQRIGENLFTFCPSGVWVTNGASAQKISDPVKKYTENFQPIFDVQKGRVVTNCFAGQYRDKYYLYIHDPTQPEARSDVVLVYDTIKNNWTVHDTYTNFAHFASLKTFGSAQTTGALTGGSVTQFTETLFAGDTGGKYWRLFEDTWQDNQATRGKRGGDLTANLNSNSLGTSVQTIAETKLYPIGNEPTQWSSLDRIAVLTERGTFQVSYKLDRGDKGGMTDWISLGDFKTSITTTKLKHNLKQGYRIAFKVTSSERDTIGIFNGIILKGRETIDTEKYGI